MKNLIALSILSLIVSACGSAGGGSAQAASPNVTPAQDAFTLGGNYKVMVASTTFINPNGRGPCAVCFKTCRFEPTYRHWSCDYDSAYLPAACTVTPLGEFSLSSDGTSITDTGGMYSWIYYKQWNGVPNIKWIDYMTAMNPITHSENNITISAINYTMMIDNPGAFADGHVERVVTFQPGCSFAFLVN